MHAQTNPQKTLHKSLSPLVHLMAAGGLIVMALPVGAQTTPDQPKADSGEVQSVVVTAQKRSQRLKDVPVALSVVNAEQLEKQGIRDLGDLAKSAASLEFGDQKTGGAGGSASIRGIGTAVFTTSAESSVGVVVDGVPLGNTAGGALFDMERVEVLRGPQGTLFGKSASAGVLNLVSKSPVLGRFGGFANVELSGGDVLGSKLGNTVVRGGLNVPLTDDSALRVTAHSDRQTGVYFNVFNNTDSATTGNGVRVRYLLKPDADLAINLIAEHDRSKATGATFFAPAIAYDSNTAGNHAPKAEFAACGVTVSLRNNTVCSDALELNTARVSGLSAQIDKTLANGLTLTSITAARERSTGPDSAAIDMSQGWDKVRTSDSTKDIRQFSQELRLSSPGKQEVDWVAGLFLSDYHSDKHIITTILPPPYVPSPPVPRSITNTADTVTDSRSAALFGQASFKLNEQFSALAGLRYTRDKVEDTQTQSSVVAFAPFTLPATIKTGSASITKSNLSGKVGLQAVLDKDTNVYATLSRGYKAPQIDNDTPMGLLTASGTTTGDVVKAEQPTSLELGLKTSLLNRRLDVDVALFRTTIKDFQEQNCTLTAIGALNCIPLNVPKVLSYGLELDLRARPMAGLTVNASSAVILGTEYPTGFQFDGQDVGGQRLLYSPKGKVTLGVEYTTGIFGDYEWSLGADVTYKTAVRLCNTLAPECSYQSHTIVGLRTGVRSPDDKWGVGLFVRNAGDERVPNAILYPLPGKGAGSGYAYSLGGNSFRSVGITADMKF